MKHSTSIRLASASATLFLLTVLFCGSSFASFDAYLKIKGKDGVSYQAKIDPATGDCVIKGVPAGTYTTTVVASEATFTFHSGDPSTIEVSSFSWGTMNVSGTGLGAGKASMGDLSIMKTRDMSSPSMMRESPTKGGFTNKRCKLFVRKAGSDHNEYYTIALDQITISGGGEENPTESRAAGGVKTGYDVKANVKF